MTDSEQRRKRQVQGVAPADFEPELAVRDGERSASGNGCLLLATDLGGHQDRCTPSRGRLPRTPAPPGPEPYASLLLHLIGILTHHITPESTLCSNLAKFGFVSCSLSASILVDSAHQFLPIRGRRMHILPPSCACATLRYEYRSSRSPLFPPFQLNERPKPETSAASFELYCAIS